MSELLYQSPVGIKIFREDYKKRSQVKVCSEYRGKSYTLRSYRFNNIPDRFDSPYCSWANLDCCGGWSYDESYLDTAVQQGKKIYAGRYQFLKSSIFPDRPTKGEAIKGFQKFCSGLPDGVVAAIEKIGRDDVKDILYTYICRTGCIADYFDLNSVFDFYAKLGLHYPQYIIDQVKELCSIEIRTYGEKEAPFLYYQAGPDTELITTGLLLGYPIESTASIILGY